MTTPNPGTLEKPFKTFEKARDAVRGLKATATDEIVVAFKAGNYGSLNNLTFTAEDAGTETVPIKYCAYGDGEVEFSNGVNILNEEFVPIEESDHYLFNEKNYGNISKAYIGDKIDKIGQYSIVFSGSNICWEARYPNKSDGSDNFITDMTTREDQFKSIRLEKRAKSSVDGFRTTENMKVTGLLRYGWLTDTFLVESYDKETGILAFDFDNPDFDSFGDFPMIKWDHGIPDENGDLGEAVLMYEDRYEDSVFFHNLSDQLDQTGEYWIDTENMMLYVYDPTGDYTISDGGAFMTLEDGADHISFTGLCFNGSTDTGVTVFGNNVTFDLCRFENIAGYTAIMADTVHGFTVKNSEFAKIGQTSVYLYSDADMVNVVTGENVIYNNYFHDSGYLNYWANAVNINNDVESVISHNLFENLAGRGISYSRVMCSVIEYNIFDNLMISTSDGAGFGYGMTGIVYRGNAIRYNLFKNMESGVRYGVYLDQCTSGHEVYGNLFYKCNSGVVMNGGRDNKLYDNIFIDTGAFSSNAVYYHYYLNGNTDSFAPGNTDYNDWFGQGNPKKPGDPGYEKWYSLFPELYDVHLDVTRIDEPECIFSNVNYFDNNACIGCKVGNDDPTSVFTVTGRFNGNAEYSIDENPLFVNPTIGDYRIKEDADFAKIPFDKIGRE